MWHGFCVANFSENTTVKEFWKSANICRSYERMYTGSFFWLTVYYYFALVCYGTVQRY